MARSSPSSALLALLLAGCGDAGTFVLVRVEGGDNPPTSATQAVIDADLGVLHDSHVVDLRGATLFPFTLVLDLRRGEGRLKVRATARDSTTTLATGSSEVDVARGETAHVTVVLGREQILPDGGLPDAGPPDAALGPAPRLIAPPSGATTTALEVDLGFSLPAGATDPQVDLCPTRACATTLPGVSFADPARLASTGTLTRGETYFWRVRAQVAGQQRTSATWQFTAGGAAGLPRNHWGAGFDCNGDGEGDLAVSEPGANRVWVLPRAGAGFGAPIQLPAPDGPGGFGLTMASAGDVNGDGYGDLLVGAQAMQLVYVFHGGPACTETTPARRWSASGPDMFGWALAAAGDVDADGYADVVIGAPGVMLPTRPMAGRAYLYRGSAGGALTTPIELSGAQPGVPGTPAMLSAHGWSVAGIGSTSGGFGRVIVCAPGDGHPAMPQTGSCLVYTGQAGGIAANVVLVPAPASLDGGANMGQRFGEVVAPAGDIDGDGLPDVVVGQPMGRDAAGAATGVVGVLLGANLAARAQALPGMMGEDFGGAVAGLGDIDGDGFSDVGAAAPNASQGSGRLARYRGGGGPLALAPPGLVGPAGARLGQSLAGLGDLNNDNLSDYAAGMPGFNTGVGACVLFISMPPGHVGSQLAPPLPAGSDFCRRLP